MAAPKVAICIPSADTFKADAAMALAALAAYSIHTIGLALMNEKSSMITHARNSLTRKALDLGADYLLWVDSDMAFGPDALVRLLAHEKDIVAALYRKRVPPFEPLGRIKGPQRELTGGLVEAECVPGGMVLDRADVYRKIAWPWYHERYAGEHDPAPMTSEDVVFCQQALDAGFRIWVDLDVTAQVRHIGEQAVGWAGVE